MPRLLVDIGPVRRNKNFRLLFAGQLVSLLGSNLTIVAVPYQVYRETHSSTWVGVASLIQLPFLIAGSLWGGALGDRYDRRTLLVLGSFVLGVFSAALALNAQMTQPHFAALVLLAAGAAGAAGFAGPIRTAVIPTLVPPEELVAAYSINQVIVNVAAVVGPSIAGVLLASVGTATCYWLDAATFAVLMVATSFMSSMRPAGEHDGVRLLQAIGDGFRYIRSHATAQAVYLIDLNAMVFGLPRALFPAVALTMYHGGPRILGLLYAAPGAGALVMAVMTGWIARVRRQGRLVVLVVVAWGAAMALFGLVHVVWIGLACLAFAGATDVVSTVLRNTILQLAITDEFRSRVSAIQMSVVTGGPRLGDLEAGVVAGLTSTEFSIISGGVACIIGAMALARWRPTFWNNRIG
ncbi:MAG TPA: MFS transporter [Acidimicrobiales bacterium]|nr:MFS transporter [Acidimicrobiales bacterium]